MGLLEQQWVTVQQKTFTKWFDPSLHGEWMRDWTDPLPTRLNSKVASRNVAVNDLVTDLSDGVGHLRLAVLCLLALARLR